MGAEGSVTLQLREAVQAPVNESTATINNVTIGYPDPDVLADVISTFQAATGSDGTFDVIDDTGRPQILTNTFFKAANTGKSTTTINKTETGTWSVYEFLSDACSCLLACAMGAVKCEIESKIEESEVEKEEWEGRGKLRVVVEGWNKSNDKTRRKTLKNVHYEV